MKMFIAVALMFSSSSLFAQNEYLPTPHDAKSLLEYYAAHADSPTTQARVYLSAGAAMQLGSSLEATAVLSPEDRRYQLLADCFDPSLYQVALVDATNWLASNEQFSDGDSYNNVLEVRDFLLGKQQQTLEIGDATTVFFICMASFLLIFVVLLKRHV